MRECVPEEGRGRYTRMGWIYKIPVMTHSAYLWVTFQEMERVGPLGRVQWQRAASWDLRALGNISEHYPRSQVKWTVSMVQLWEVWGARADAGLGSREHEVTGQERGFPASALGVQRLSEDTRFRLPSSHHIWLELRWMITKDCWMPLKDAVRMSHLPRLEFICISK